MKNSLAVILLCSFFLSACAPVSTPASTATQLPKSPAPTRTIASTPGVTLLPSATHRATHTPQPTETPNPAAAQWTTFTPFPSPTSIPTLQPGQPVGLTSLHMIDAAIGWGIEKSGHILRTRDGGLTWMDVTPPEGVYNQGGFFALDGMTAWANPFQKECHTNCPPFQPFTTIWRTDDGGTTWQASEPLCLGGNCGYDYGINPAYYFTVQMQFLNKKTGWLLVTVQHIMFQDRYRIYHTSNGGLTWEFILDNMGGPMVFWATGLAFQDEQTGWFSISQVGGAEEPHPNWHIYKATDGGHTWNQTNLPEPAPLPETFAKNTYWCGASKVNALPPKTIDLTFYCDVYLANARPRYDFHFHSFNSGETWTSWQETGGVSFINATEGWRLSARDIGEFNLEQTTDGGAHWAWIKTVQWGGSLEFVSKTEGWALATNGEVTALIHTKDGGQTWAEIKPIISAPGTNLTTLRMFSETTGWSLEKSGRILRTRDGGLIWLDVTPDNGTYESRDFFALDAGQAWAVNNSIAAIWHTIDGGKTWEKAQNPAANDFTVKLYFLNAQTGWYFGESHGHGISHQGLASTLDGGKTWEKKRNFDSEYSLYTDMLVVNQQVLYLSGRAWGDIRDYIGQPTSLDYLTGKVSPRLQKSADGGETWSMVSLPRLGPIPDGLQSLASSTNVMDCGVTTLNFIHPNSTSINASVTCQVGQRAEISFFTMSPITFLLMAKNGFPGNLRRRTTLQTISLPPKSDGGTLPLRTSNRAACKKPPMAAKVGIPSKPPTGAPPNWIMLTKKLAGPWPPAAKPPPSSTQKMAAKPGCNSSRSS